LKILALDLATHTGWAFQYDNGACSSGVTPFLGTLQPGQRWIRFSAWLESFAQITPDFIFYERPILHHSSASAAELAFGFSTRVQEFCALKKIRCHSVHNGTLKKYATGSGRADKAAMLRFGRTYWPNVTDHNECDALWLLEYARKVILKGTTP
jgi:hypothetical protein